MKRNILFITIVVIIMGLISFGCDSFKKEEIPPENLPPVPETCAALSDEYSQALVLAQSAVESSQLQITRVASHFVQCMQDAGLSEAEAKGIIKNIEKTVRKKEEKSSGQEEHFYR